jgi:Methyltransferase domain
VPVAKRLIDKKFPGRHTLVCGDSRDTVPAFAARNPGLRFDLVFIDGGHDYEVAKADLMNMRPLCTDTTVVIMDDLMPEWPFGEGPTRSWDEAIDEGLVSQDESCQAGRFTPWKPGRFRRWARGRYVFD